VRFSLSTFLFQTVNFLILVWVLRRFLFRPVQRIVDQRRQKIEAAMADAERSRAAIAGVDEQIARRRADADAAAESSAADARQRAQAERQKLLDGARAQAEGIVTGARAQIEREREEALTGLERRASGLAAELAGSLVRSGGAEAVTAVLLAQALRDIERQPPGARERFLGDSPEAVTAIRVVTAIPLGEDARARCHAELARLLGRPVDVDFADDEALLAGAELHFQHTVLRHSWREHLGAASRGMVDDAAGDAGRPESREGRHGKPADVA